MSDGGEFEFIDRLRSRVPTGDEAVGIGDDAAVLADGTLAAVDTLVEGRHVRLDWATPEAIGWKALVVNLSDLAAMGGRPTAGLAAVTLPPTGADLADRLATGLIEASTAFDCPLVGGDTTAGPTLVLSVTVLGRPDPEYGPVLRRGADVGDAVFVTGRIGAAAQAYTTLGAGGIPDERHAEALHRPVPRLAEGQVAAAAGASAMIDVSDGLGADLGHLLDASGVGVEIDGEAVPVADGV
ncbi:MAG: thiamine-phosphate kinase, partial [Actinomycetota bacterium]